MIIGMTRKLIQIRPPGDTLRGTIVIFRCLGIRARCGGLFQFSITGEKEGSKDRKEKDANYRQNADQVAWHGLII
jgi:hypothetical protein